MGQQCSDVVWPTISIRRDARRLLGPRLLGSPHVGWVVCRSLGRRRGQYSSSQQMFDTRIYGLALLDDASARDRDTEEHVGIILDRWRTLGL